jgi:hypothetical protein
MYTLAVSQYQASVSKRQFERLIRTGPSSADSGTTEGANYTTVQYCTVQLSYTDMNL